MFLLNVKATACPAYPSSYVGYFRLEQAMKLKLADINPKDPSNVPCRPYSSCSSLLMPPGPELPFACVFHSIHSPVSSNPSN